MRWLWPTMTNGTPGSVTPATSKLPLVVFRCASNHRFGIWWSRCISFDSSGFPETVCCPETTQLFDPGRNESSEYSAPEEFARRISSPEGNRARQCLAPERRVQSRRRTQPCEGRRLQPSASALGTLEKCCLSPGGTPCHRIGRRSLRDGSRGQPQKSAARSHPPDPPLLRHPHLHRSPL